MSQIEGESTPPIQIVTAPYVFDGDRVLPSSGGVAVLGDQIVAVGDEQALERFVGARPAVQHSYPGCTLLPGLIDVHSHVVMEGRGASISEWALEKNETLLLVAAANVEKAVRAGVTTLVDLGGKDDITFRLREAVRRHIVLGPRLILCGRALTITGGHAWPWHGEADGVDGVQKAVRQLCKEGADLIKVMVTGGGTPGTDGRRTAFSTAELDALVAEAHRQGRRVFAHCTATEGIRQAYEAGVDVVVHAQFIGANGAPKPDHELVARLSADGVAVNPTLAVNRVLATRTEWNALGRPERERLRRWTARYSEFEESVRQMHRHGVRLLAGSDCGWGWLRFGETHLETAAMEDAGLSAVEVLRAATGWAADAIGVENSTGRLRVGGKADLLVVDGDATASVTRLRDVNAVWVEGRQVEGPLGPPRG